MEVNTDDLVGAREVAEMIGLTNPKGVSVYRRRHADFPTPAVDRERCVLWRRQDVEAWAKATGRP